jgi:hypothetical protein
VADLASARIDDVRAFARRWRDEGLPIVAAQALLFGRPDLLLLGPPDVRRQTIDYLRLVFDLCAAAGATTMVFGSPRNRRREGRSTADAMAIATDAFRGSAGGRRPRAARDRSEPHEMRRLHATVRDAVALVHFRAHRIPIAPRSRLHDDGRRRDRQSIALGAADVVPRTRRAEPRAGRCVHGWAAGVRHRARGGGYDGWLSQKCGVGIGRPVRSRTIGRARCGCCALG